MKWLKKQVKPICMPHWLQDVLLAVPRIVCGYLMAFDFGASKFGMPWSPAENNLKLFEVAFWFPEDVASYGGIFKMMPAFFAWMGAFSEAIGGLFLIVGLCTRPFSYLLVITMMVAVFLQQWDNGLWSMLAGMGFMWVFLFTAVTGSGRFGIDYIISKKLK
jgi:putative oxidoreductase